MDAAALLLSWLATAWVHCTLALLTVAGVERAGWLRGWSAREWAWRSALLLPLLSAALVLGDARPVAEPTIEIPPGVDSQLAQAPGLVIAPNGASEQRSRDARPVRAATAQRLSSRLADDSDTRSGAAAGQAWALAPGWLLVLLATWLLLVAAGGWRLWRHWRHLLRHASRLPAESDAALLSEVEALARTAGIAIPTTLRDAQAASPLVTPAGQLLLPAWITTLPTLEQRSVLAHEIAHLRRGDARWRLCLELRRVLLPTPLLALALRRLQDLAELQCDRWAAQAGSGRALAECLSDFACRVRRQPPPQLAAAMAQPDSALLQRIHHLLTETPMSSRLQSLVTPLIPLLMAAALLALPLLQLTPAVAASNPARPAAATSPSARGVPTELSQRSSQIQETPFGRSLKLDQVGAGYALKIRAEGRFQVREDERDLASLSDQLSIEESLGGVTRRIDFERGGDGIERRYRVNGQDRELDAEGREWVAAMLGTLLRESAIDVQARSERIHARGGMPALLAEISQIRSDHARGRYLANAFEHFQLSQAEVARALELAALTESDYELRRVLIAAIEHARFSAASQVLLLRTAQGIGSDYESRLLLQAAVPRMSAEAEVFDAWLTFAATVQSDYELRLALTTLAEHKDLQAAQIAELIDTTASIGSDYECRLALSAIAERLGDASLGARFAVATRQIGSGYERRLALQALLDAIDINPEAAAAVLESIAGIGSDYEARLVLVDLADHLPADQQLIARYRQIAAELGKHERTLAEQALGRRVL